MEPTIEDHRIVLACNDVLVDHAPAATCTPHGLTYDVLHEGIVMAIYPQFQPAFHPVLDVTSLEHARTFVQDTRGKDQGAFRVTPPLTNTPKFPCHH